MQSREALKKREGRSKLAGKTAQVTTVAVGAGFMPARKPCGSDKMATYLIGPCGPRYKRDVAGNVKRHWNRNIIPEVALRHRKLELIPPDES